MANKRTNDIKRQEAQTARHLAFALAGGLLATVGLQYLVLTALALLGHEKAIPVFEHLFNAWLPVISGLTGAAASYYLSKRPALVPQQATANGKREVARH